MTPRKLPSLSIFLLCYNDEKTISHLVDKAYSVGSAVTKSLEAIVINDGSTDNSSKILESSKRTHPTLRVIHHHRNKGYGGALRSGFKAVTKEFVFYTDGDQQYDISELPLLIAALRPGIDVVNGKITWEKVISSRRLSSALYSGWIRLMFGLPVSDINVAFRLIRRSVLKKINLTFDSGALCVELLVKLKRDGAKFTETPVHHYPRPYGRSQFLTVKRVAKTIWDDIYLFWISRSW